VVNRVAELGTQFFTAPQNAGLVFARYKNKLSITNFAILGYVFPSHKEYFTRKTKTYHLILV
jgi:hypothetical protein